MAAMDQSGNRPTDRRAKIVCTIGPASNDRETIEALASAGMAVARFNASHGEVSNRRTTIERVQAVAGQGDPIATMLDLPGPEIRTAPIETPIELDADVSVEFAPGESASPSRIGLTASIDSVQPGDEVLLDDGRIETVVRGVDGDVVTATVTSGGELGSRVGVNVPGVDLGLPMVTDADERELDLAAETGVDFVAASFVRTGADVYAVSAALEARDADIPIVAKIERADAVRNLDEIVEAASAVMVARGDLGVECPLEDVPLIQKRTIRRCHRAGVPVITATEMLDSMVHARRPTRAEASDVANAVLDGTDAVMLSGETAVGDHPVRVVETMARIVADIEDSDEYAQAREQQVPSAGDTRTDALARSARYLARDIGASAIVAASESGYTARKAAKYRPSIPIVAASPDDGVRRELTLSWGITPVAADYEDGSADAVIQRAVQAALDTGVAESGDTVVVLSGMMTRLEGLDATNVLKVHVASETLAAGRSVVAGHVTGPLVRVDDGDLSGVAEGSIVAVPRAFEGEFAGDLSVIGGIVDAHEGMTGYAAIVARELEVPMICGAEVPEDVDARTEVTLDAERGVLYGDPLASGAEDS
jgi:pyruvate kinase